MAGPVIAAGSTGSIPATAELIATIARLPHGAVVLPGLDTDLDEESWRLIAGGGGLRRRRPSAIRHAGPARAHRHRARGDRILGGTVRARAAHFRGAAAGGGDRSVAAKRRRSGVRGARGRRAADAHADRSGQCRGRSARHRGGAARGGARRQDGSSGHAGPRARASRARRAGALGHRGGGFRRRCACRHAGGDFCAACRRSRARRPCPGDAARACSSIRCCGSA